MKRFHVHVSVNDLAQSVRFYSKIFGAAPTVEKDDYAKWMLDDPRINFAISERGDKPGVNHLGLQVDAAEELAALRQQIAAAEIAAEDEPAAECCYARSDKYWIQDPQGIAWEAFHSQGTIELYDGSACGVDAACGTAAGGCCADDKASRPAAPARACCS